MYPQADFNRRWARLDESILKAAFELKSKMILYAEEGKEVDLSRFSIAEDTDSISCFENLPYAPRPLPPLDPKRITNFEEAREVFLRAAGRLEVAKKDFPMDGKKRIVAVTLTHTI